MDAQGGSAGLNPIAKRAVELTDGAIELHQAGEREEATELARAAVELLRSLRRFNSRLGSDLLARSLDILGVVSRGQGSEALQAAEEAVALYRELTARTDKAFLPNLARSLLNLGVALHEAGRCAEALHATEEALALNRNLAARNRYVFLPEFAQSLSNLDVMLSETGRHPEALQAAEEALALRRELVGRNREAFLPDLAQSLSNLGTRRGSAGRHAEAIQAAEEALALYRELAARSRKVFLPDLVRSLSNLSILLSEAGRYPEALQAAEEALVLLRELDARNRETFLPDLAQGMRSLGIHLGKVGQRAEALQAAEEAVALHHELAAHNREAFLPDLAMSLDILGVRLGEANRRAEALHTAEEALSLYRELAARNPEAFSPDFARSLHNKCLALAAMGRGHDALQTQEESVSVFRHLAATDPSRDLTELTTSLDALVGRLLEFGRNAEASRVSGEASSLWRKLVETSRSTFLPKLADALIMEGHAWALAHPEHERFLSSDRIATDAHDLIELASTGWRATMEGCDLFLELAKTDWATYRGKYAASLVILGEKLLMCGRLQEALQNAELAADVGRQCVLSGGAQDLRALIQILGFLARVLARLERWTEVEQLQLEALSICRQLLAATPEDQDLSRLLASLLREHGMTSQKLGSSSQALAAVREQADLVIGSLPANVKNWCAQAESALAHLGTAEDLRCRLLPLLHKLIEHREVASRGDDAKCFSSLQGILVDRIWAILPTLTSAEADSVDSAVAGLAGALHSPDLQNWLCILDSQAGQEASELLRRVIEADQAMQLPYRSNLAGLMEQMEDLQRQIHDRPARQRAAREAFSNARMRLAREDPNFAAAFGPLSTSALRHVARHAGASAVLCLFEQGIGDRSRTIAALVYSDGSRTQLLELPELAEVVRLADFYEPGESSAIHRGALRGASVAPKGGSPRDASPPSIADLLAPRMSESFWAPLQQALQASGVAVERLHVCLHGTTQQLPLALRQDSDCPGLQVVPWPGLPYLRRAAMATSAKSESHTGADASAPWLIGHDCAWGSAQPLPMVAVEAALLRDLLQRHGQPVQQIRLAAQLHGQASALVACCHGGAEQAQFDHALHLGAEPLTVRQIVQENIGPPLALLPACHAGRTDEDAAGNALGVAAAFMLSGTRVVAASSKAVPDLLQPWLSTLTVWHAMQDLPHHEAANLAREQFARLDFPEGYRGWLQQALPQALATIQPGGEEDEHIRGVHAQTALEQVEERWPWEGETKDLFSADPARREAATRSVVQGVLKPRGGEAGARALAAEAREMVAFVFVYGVDSTSGCLRHEPDQDADHAEAEKIT